MVKYGRFIQQDRLDAFNEVTREVGIDSHIANVDTVKRMTPCSKKTAIICSSDLCALRIMDFAKENKLGIIGFDNIRILELLNIKLDSVAYDTKETARGAFELIVEGKRLRKAIPHRIVERGSI